jgi:hypothetical protein
MGSMNQYMDDYVSALNATTTFHTAGNGAFIHSCYDHCDGELVEKFNLPSAFPFVSFRFLSFRFVSFPFLSFPFLSFPLLPE